jgi:hypothetical protein
MLQYTVISDGNFLIFTGINDTLAEGYLVAHQKSLVKQVLEDAPKSALVIVDSDDWTHEYQYDEVVNPVTGTAFPTLEAFRLYVITELNSVLTESSQFIDNWNSDTNTPVLASGGLYDVNGDLTPETIAPNSYYFIVIAADANPLNNTTLDGENGWQIGDLVRSTGSKWVRQPRVVQTAAYNTSYVTDIGSTDPNWVDKDNVQIAIDELYTRVSDFNGSLADLSDVDLDTTPPIASDSLVYDGSKWVPAQGGGRELIVVRNNVDGTVATTETVNGFYVVSVGATHPWLPAGSGLGDIVQLSSGLWTLYRDMSTKLAGSTEIEYSVAPFTGANYVWGGSTWLEIDAYEPNSALNAVSVSNPNLGDLSTGGYTGSSLRGRSISKILDDILFQTVPATYTPIPSLAVSSSIIVFPSGANIDFERGQPLSGNMTGNYTKGAGGNLDSTDPTYIGGNELSVNLTLAGVPQQVIQSTHAAGNRSLSLSAAGRNIQSIAATSSVGSFVATANTADGAIKYDNKGNPTTRPASVLRQTLTTSKSFFSRYPLWVGGTPERFKISNLEYNTTSVAPNDGTYVVGPLLDNAWLQGAGVGLKRLYTANNPIAINTASGDAHLLIVCPPGITVTSILEYVIGNWVVVPFGTHYSSFTLNNITSLSGAEPRSYTCYYLRDLTSMSLPIRQFTINIAGSIQP